MKTSRPTSSAKPESSASLRGLILDIEGTLCTHGRPIPGALATLEALRGAGVDLRLVTNTSAIPPSAVSQRLRAMGFDVLDRHVFTPARAALHYLSGRADRRCMYLVSDAIRPLFTSLEAESDDANIVLMGDMGDAFTFHGLNRAFRRIQGGAELVLLQDNPWWRAPDGPTLDCGAFAAALQHATGKIPRVLGKPNPFLLELAQHDMGLACAEIAVVGDSPRTDIAAAHAAGMRSVLVGTGKFLANQATSTDPLPSVVLPSIASVPEWIARELLL
ncbi:MAG TPA: HAD-IIA family hydrolase [Polyangiaceae bacterium]|nr:HAD-IIA family hydrolase [Polyangiaceae bacterium]